MAFHNVKLPDELALGFMAGPSANTVVQSTASGHEYRVSRQSQMRHRYQAAKQALTYAEFSALVEFFVGRRGALHGFRFKDWGDFTTATDGVSAPNKLDVALGTGDGTTTDFQLIKKYDASGPAPYARTLTLPVTSSVVAHDGSGGTPTFSVVATTGVISFATAPANGNVVTAGCEFDVPVRLSSKSESWLNATHDHYNNLSWSSIELLEILDEVEWPELWDPGGSTAGASGGYLDTAEDVILAATTKVWALNATTSGLKAFLPAVDRIPGGEVFTILVGTGNTLQLVDDVGANVGSALATSSVNRVALLRGTTTATWLVY